MSDSVRTDHPKAAFHYEARGLLDEWAYDNYRATLNSIGHEIIALLGEAVQAQLALEEKREREATPDNVRALESARRHSDPTIRPAGCA